MIIIIAPGLILFCVLIVALVALSHITAGALIAMVAILAGAGIITAIAVAVMHARVVPVVEPPRSRLTAQALVTRDGIGQLPPPPVWTAEPILDTPEPTRAQLEAAFRYMAKVYGEAGRVADFEAIEPAPRKDESS